MEIQFSNPANWIQFMGDLFRNKGRFDALVPTKNNINTFSHALFLAHSLLGTQIYFRLRALPSFAACPALTCVRLVLLLCCQHKEGRLRKRSAREEIG